MIDLTRAERMLLLPRVSRDDLHLTAYEQRQLWAMADLFLASTLAARTDAQRIEALETWANNIAIFVADGLPSRVARLTDQDQIRATVAGLFDVCRKAAERTSAL